MQCYEHEMMCLTLEAAVREIHPAARPDRLDVSETLAAAGIASLAALLALAPADVAALAERLLPEVSLAA